MSSIRTGRSGPPVGIAEMLAAYDDYPRLVRERDAARAKVENAVITAQEAEDKRDDIALQLQKEQAGRKNDALRAAEEKKEAERATDKKVRGELDPKIKELRGKVDELTKERNKLKDEIAALRRQMGGWVSSMERLHKQRNEAAEAEKKAEESRMELNTKLRDLDTKIMEGLKLASETGKPLETDKSEVEKPMGQTRTSLAASRGVGR